MKRFRNTGRAWPDNWEVTIGRSVAIIMFVFSLIVAIVTGFVAFYFGFTVENVLGWVCGYFSVIVIMFITSLILGLIRKQKGSS